MCDEDSKIVYYIIAMPSPGPDGPWPTGFQLNRDMTTLNHIRAVRYFPPPEVEREILINLWLESSNSKNRNEEGCA